MRGRYNPVTGEVEWYDPDSIPRPKQVAPHIWGDLKPYVSPVTWREVDGRRAHREDLNRAGARILEKGEGPNLDAPKTFEPKADVQSMVLRTAQKIGLI